MVSCEGDRCYDPPRGVHGGSDGRPGVLTHIAADGTETILPSKFSGLRVSAGAVIRFESPLGGGYGPPLERDPEATLADVRDGYLTAEEARRQYGVALSGGGLAVDAEQTAALRHGRQDRT
jgi:N-methylhydantoinase B/oxoprolinase/acetone carboxylase alpha subunit